MATHKLGKFKFNTSEDGIAFRFGDGKIHRLGLSRRGKDAQPQLDEEYLDGEDYEESYAPADDFAAEGYSGRFAGADDLDRYDPAYDDPNAEPYEDFDDYAEDEYADADYPEDGYAQDDYASDDRFDDSYYDENGDYGAEDGEYDDRYSDEDAEDYDDYDDAPYGNDSAFLRYVDENDWVTYLLLVLLPPLGIYLLWHRRRFERPIRWAVSVASGVWFILALVLLISLLLAGNGDVTKNPPMTLVTPTPTVEVSASPTAGDQTGTELPGSDEGSGSSSLIGSTSGGSSIGDALAIDATATPIPASSSGGSSSANTVIMTPTGPYYHNNASCPNIEAGAAISNVIQSVAISASKTACPICYPGQETYYATETGKYYHTDSTCSGMTNATVTTKEAATERGQTACPVCIQHAVNTLDKTGLKFATASTKDKSNMIVYATSGGRYFHTDATCSGMQDAMSGGLLKAMLAGKTACPKCASGATKQVWCTQGGKMYHNKSNCSGMENAYQVTLAEALILGKTRCTTCWGASTGSSGTTSTSTSSSGGTYVYATASGKYYHTNSTCSGMTGASRVTLASMISAGRAACPVCCAGADRVVYATKNGQYYHSYANCSGMQDAQASTLAKAIAAGKKRCPSCWAGSDSGVSTTGSSADASKGGTYVYCTQKGTYYHTKSTCSGMTGASRVTLATAVSAGKRACPTCASAASRMVYSTDHGAYYHVSSTCSGMSGAKQRTLESAIALGQTACPVCIRAKVEQAYKEETANGALKNVTSAKFTSSKGSTSSTTLKKLTSSGKYKAGTSGIKVYATASGKYYHTKSSCAGSGAAHISLETALNYGKTACPKCASSAKTSVYAVKGGKYYHYSKTCAGTGAVKGSRASALAIGLDPCPYCVTGTKTLQSSGKYKAGTSGIKVYATVSGKYYHSSRYCAGANASHITLETALNYGKTACPNCAASAQKTVYATATGKYYHSSKTHAGAGAVAGSFAKALAMGKKECPVCIGGSESYEVSDIKYSAPGDTTVYVDIDSNALYYHKNKSCKDAGVSSGTGVMLEFVLQWGFKACPFCNPATSVK